MQRRQVVCYRKERDKIEVLEDDDCSGEERPESEKACNLRPCEGLDWVTSEWSGVRRKYFNLCTGFHD